MIYSKLSITIEGVEYEISVNKQENHTFLKDTSGGIQIENQPTGYVHTCVCKGDSTIMTIRWFVLEEFFNEGNIDSLMRLNYQYIQTLKRHLIKKK